MKAAGDPTKAATVDPPTPPTSSTTSHPQTQTGGTGHDDGKKPPVNNGGGGGNDGGGGPPQKKQPTIDELMEIKGATEAIKDVHATKPDTFTTFTGQERAQHEPQKISAEVQRVLPYVAAAMGHNDAVFEPGVNAIKVMLNDGAAKGADRKFVVIEIRVVPTEGNDIATFRFTGMETAVIEISDRARDKHVERALADLVSEIRATREAHLAGKALPKESALKPGSKATELNGNDLGNIAQLQALLRQLENAKYPLNGNRADSNQVKQLNTDITNLLDSLGVTGMEAGRMELIDKRLTERQREILNDRHGEPDPQRRRQNADPLIAKDANMDGVTDASRVGVGGMEVPDKIPRLNNLPPEAAAAQKRFAEAYESPGGKEAMAKQYLEHVTAQEANGIKKTAEERKTFGTDDAKILSEDYNPTDSNLSKEQRLAARGMMNLAVHNTANAIAKEAFLMRLDQIKNDGGGMIMITAGGVAAGKGHAIKNNEIARGMVERAAVIWDTAGEQNSTELPWVIAEAKKRGLTVEILYVHQRPENSWPRVVSRAQKEGRMVDARLHAESYAEGARNFDAVQRANPGVKTVIVDVSGDKPTQIENLPKDALTLDADTVQQKNTEYLKKQKDLGVLGDAILAGGFQQGEAVWGPPEHRAAIAELGGIPVSMMAAGAVVQGHEGAPLTRNTYFVTQSDGKRMLELLLKLGPEVQTRMFEKGFIIRRTTEGALHEWYFEFNDTALKSGAKQVAGERGSEHGLPKPNAATIELWGFSGVRTINGRTKEHWTEKEKAEVARARSQEPLLFAGHIGISLDGGKTIIGFTPKPPEGMTMAEFLKSLMDHDAFPGILGNDTQIFIKAAEMARERGWNTEPISAVQLVDQAKKMEVVDEAARLSGMKPGEHGFGYSFPLRPEERKGDGENFAGSNGFPATCVRNCGAFPEKLGVPIPEPSGNVKLYMPELEKWANEDGPKDFRDKDVKGTK